jgi:hypothetical protein
MKKIIYSLLVVIGITSCVKENPKPITNVPIIIPSTITDTINDTIKAPNVTDTLKDTTIDLVGQTWVISQVRIGEFGNPTTINDTLEFISNSKYVYNTRATFKYSFYYTGGGFNLTLNGSYWGNITGTVYYSNIVSGYIMGIRFSEITPGSSNDTKYYLWMTKIN